MAKKPLVSIIIPAYNSEKYLEECIQSAIHQTWENTEIIIINDGSTDRTAMIAEKYINENILLINQTNTGASSARNVGIELAKGDYIQFLDADDILSSNKIESQVSALNGSKTKVACCPTIHFYEGTNYLKAIQSPKDEVFLYTTENPLQFLVNLWGGYRDDFYMVQTNAWLIPKEIIDRNRPWEVFYSPDDDGEYFCRILMTSNGIIYTDKCFNYYRKFKKNISLSNKNSYMALEGCYKSILCKKKTLNEYINQSEVRRAIANQLIPIAMQSYPKYPKLTKIIDKEIKQLNTPYYTPELGGKIINGTSRILGWKIARIIQSIYNLASN